MNWHVKKAFRQNSVALTIEKTYGKHTQNIVEINQTRDLNETHLSWKNPFFLS